MRTTLNGKSGRLHPLAFILTVSGLAMGVDTEHAQAQDADSAVTEVVDAYHTALVSGDSTTAVSLLADDVTILESGRVEDKEHYRSGHLAGDMRFAATVPRKRSEIRVTVLSDAAWAWSTNTAQGRMGEREVNSRGAELMVLIRQGERWMISAIHWSSRAVR